MNEIPHIEITLDELPKRVELYRFCCGYCRKTITEVKQGIQECPYCHHVGFTFDEAIYLKIKPKQKLRGKEKEE
jgi:hypothetical protein